jgi:hypothetical protein
MKCHKYTPEEIRFIKDNIAGMTRAELADLFNRKFNCVINAGRIKGVLSCHNIQSGKCHKYTPEEIRFIKDNIATHTYAELTKLFNRKFNWMITEYRLNDFLRRHNLRNFKSPIGARRIENGYTLIKTAYPNVWEKKHILIWEKANGPVPEGHVIMFADRNRRNFRLDNLLPVSRKELGVMNKRRLVFPDAVATRAGHQIAKVKILDSEYRQENKRQKRSTSL